MNKTLKTFAIINIGLFAFNFLFDLFVFLTYYQYEHGIMRFVEPCGIIERVVNYLLSGLIIFGSVYYLIRKRCLIIIILCLLSFVIYFYLIRVHTFVYSGFCLCYLNEIENTLIIYLFSFVELIVLLFHIKKRKKQ
jgi:hypothetical protein